MGLMDHGIHLIDVFSWFAGSAPVHAVSNVQVAGSPAQTEFLAISFACRASGYLLYNAATYSAGLPNEGMFIGGESWMLDDSIAPWALRFGPIPPTPQANRATREFVRMEYFFAAGNR